MGTYSQTSDIMNVREMIDTAFGDLNGNTVNFKLIQTIMYLLARQLNFLERRVFVDMYPLTPKKPSSIKVTEVKIQAGKPKKGKPGEDDATASSRKGILGKKGKKADDTGTSTETSQSATDDSTKKVKHKDDQQRKKDKLEGEFETIQEMETDGTISAADKSSRRAGKKSRQGKSGDRDQNASDTDSIPGDRSGRRTDDKSSTHRGDRSIKRQTHSKDTESISDADSVFSGKDASRAGEKKSLSDDDKSSALSSDKRSARARDKSLGRASDKISSGAGAKSSDSVDDISLGRAGDKISSRPGAKSSDSIDDISLGRAGDKISSRAGAKSSDSVDDISLGRAGDKISSRAGAKSSDSVDEISLGRAGDKISSRVGAKSSDSVDDISLGRAGDKISSGAGAKSSDSVDDISSGRAGDKISSRAGAKSSDSVDDISSGRAGDKISSRAGAKSSDSVDDISLGRARDKTSTRAGDKIASSTDKRSARVGGKSSMQSSDADLPRTGSRGTHSEDSVTKRRDIPSSQSFTKTKNLDADCSSLQDKFETRREKQLRIIQQRGDSFAQRSKTPTPIRSIDSTEAQYEKLLVVERVPSAEAREQLGKRDKAPRLSIVTQEQFEQLAEQVYKIQERFGPIAMPGFPGNAELMSELRRGASLTDAMAALQLSARLEASEKVISYLTSLVQDIAKNTPGVHLDDETQVILGAPGTYGGKRGKGKAGTTETGTGFTAKSTGISKKKASHIKSKIVDTEVSIMLDEQEIESKSSSEESLHIPLPPLDTKPECKDYATYDDLEIGLQQLNTGLMSAIKDHAAQSSAVAERANKAVLSLEKRLTAALNLGNRMEELEALVSQYAEQINILDTSLSAQMSNYQEQLTQMQHDLEIGVETMLDVLANSGGDTVAIAELNTSFTNLQQDIDAIVNLQKEFKENQSLLGLDLSNLWKDIEMLREVKSDRDEVTDALRDKAGIADLNGLVSMIEFDAVRGDFEKRIAASYDKFNNQEIIWQKAIDDVIRGLSEKANIIQVDTLAAEIERYLNIMKARMKFLTDIVGEPKAAAIKKKLFRDTACLSCSTPAQMEIEEPDKMESKLGDKRHPSEGAEADPKTKGEGDGLCYPGLPIPHPRDPRSHICRRYCGGSHTVVTNPVGRSMPGLVVNPMKTPLTTEQGTDGRMYAVDAQPERKPCLPCNIVQENAGEPVTRQMETEVNRESVTSAARDVRNIVINILHDAHLVAESVAVVQDSHVPDNVNDMTGHVDALTFKVQGDFIEEHVDR